MADTNKITDSDEFDFELPPLPTIKTPNRTVDLSGGSSLSEPKENEQQKSFVRSINDILSAPDGNDPVVVPKHGTDLTSEVRITSSESIDRVMAEAEAALQMVGKIPDPFDRLEPETAGASEDVQSAEAANNAESMTQSSESDIPDLDSVDTSGIILDDMDSKVSYISTPQDDAAKALKQMVMLDDMSLEMTERPVLDDLSSEYVTVREKARGDELFHKESLNEREKKALKDRMHEEIYRRPENFNKKTGEFLQEKLMAENRLKKAKKGLLITIGAMLLTLACAALTYVGLHDYNEAYTYLAAGTIIAALLMMIKTRGTKLFAVIYLAFNTLMLAGPGLALTVLRQNTEEVDNFNQLVIGYTVPIILSGLAMFILGTSKNVAIYFTTDSEGKERVKRF